MNETVKCQDQYQDSDSSHSKEISPQKRKQGVWDEEEVLKFMIFARYNIKVLTSKLQRRTNKIFKEMSKFITTRSPTQCRSQNQKLIKKHRNFKRMIKSYEIQIGKEEFEESCLQYENQFKILNKGRKKKSLSAARYMVSQLTQTDFPNDRSQEENNQIKVEEQKVYRHQQSMDMHMPFFPLFSALQTQFLKSKIE